MRCRFCPKLKKYDIFWILFMCAAIWGVNKYQNYKVHQAKQKDVERLHELQKRCMFGDEDACKQKHQKSPAG
ncbi:Uncharacterised protein [Helicobacter mustelae]|uniref:Uncharacterized protein n=2 Tax=Helicobacter mustelae TaxID=217 RepID=D3UIM9_HELM1|nr:hypothetical protein [Helicobacter mustelae]CBG40354.1 putative hypothetical protein [Helicobacter mustelae 12198]SQH71853.1 Uncharacterised protein [Helicobacter mustelae]STP12992.1 Uncharacterised protein [Helicobacter mustelae]